MWAVQDSDAFSCQSQNSIALLHMQTALRRAERLKLLSPWRAVAVLCRAELRPPPCGPEQEAVLQCYKNHNQVGLPLLRVGKAGFVR